MIRISIFLFLLSLGLGSLQAQDTLYRKNGEKTIVRIVKVTPEWIQYKLPDYDEGPLVIIPISKVEKVVFRNGQKETFEKTETIFEKRTLVLNDTLSELRPNGIGWNLEDLMFLRMSLYYERLLDKEGMFAIKIPISFSLTDRKPTLLVNDFYTYPYGSDSIIPMPSKPNYNSYKLRMPRGFRENGLEAGDIMKGGLIGTLTNQAWYINFGNSVHTGLEFRYNRKGIRKRNFFFGFGIHGGIFNYKLQVFDKFTLDSHQTYSYTDSTYHTKYTWVDQKKLESKLGGMVSGIVEIGGRWNPTPRFSCMLSVSVGARILYMEKAVNEYFFVFPGWLIFKPQISISYNFKKKEYATFD